jgi:Tol biopolymer transport system component
MLLLASAMATSGCMLTPGDGQNIGSESSLIYFSGYTTKPDTRVYVRAINSLGSQWIHLGTAYSSSAPASLDGLTGYRWNAELTIPQSAWNGCGSNRYATVRAHAYQGTLNSDHTPITIVADGVGCWISNPNWGSFLDNCIAENSPHAIIYSNDGPPCPEWPPGVPGFLVSKSDEGVAGNNHSQAGPVSASGDVIAFASLASNLDPGADELANPNARDPEYDVFVHDAATGDTTWVSDGIPDEVRHPAISADGRYVAFYEPNQVPWSITTVFLRDLDEPSAPFETHDFTGPVEGIALSGDGRHLVVSNTPSRYWVINTGWAYSGEGLVVVDRVTGQRKPVPYILGGDRTRLSNPSITPDGFWVAYQIYYTNPPRPSWPHMRTVVASHQTGELYASILGLQPSISDDGRYIAVHRRKIVDGVELPNGIYVYDRIAAIDIEASVPAYGDSSGDYCGGPIISGNGRFVAFHCIEPMTSHGAERQIYVRDLENQTTRLASVSPTGEPANASVELRSISSDGSVVVISSGASNLGLGPEGVVQVYRIPSSHWLSGCDDGTSGQTICN